MSVRHQFTGTNVALIAVFAAVIAASTAVPEVTLAFGVPLSLQTFAVVLAGLVLGAWRGGAAVALYLVVGFAGAPIFANVSSGLAVLAGPTGGFLVGFLAAAIVVGALAELLRRRGRVTFPWLLLVGLVSVPVVYAFGIPGLALRTQLTFGEAAVAMGPFIPGDIIKVALAAGVAAVIHRAYPQLLPAAPARSAQPAVEPADDSVEENTASTA